jgi:transcriptional regulator with XRE-family HTH domain
MEPTSVEQYVSTPLGQRLFQQERAMEAVTNLLCELMAEKGISRADLAKKLGKTPGWVTQVLDGERNKTIRTLSDMFWALGHSLQFIAGSLDIRELPPNKATSSKTIERRYPSMELHLPIQHQTPDSYSDPNSIWKHAISAQLAFDMSSPIYRPGVFQ